MRSWTPSCCRKSAKDAADRIAEESRSDEKSDSWTSAHRYKKLLQSELQRFESLSGEMFPELGIDDFDDLPEMMNPAAGTGGACEGESGA